jgi:signal transduction histidine kinase
LPFSSWALYFGLFGTLVQAGTRLPTRQGLPIAAVTVTVFTVVQRFLLPHQDPLALVLGLMGWIALYGVGVSYRWVREEQARTQEALEQLRLSRAAQLESAKVEERARLAREIHDVLAHTLSALAVQLESARLLLEQRPGDPAAVLAVERAHRLAHDGLVEARRAVGTLRGATLPGPDALRTLAADFEGDTGVPCRVVVEGEPAPLSSEASLAVYRTAQEALTNVRRHARATSVTVRLRWKGDGAELTVEDQGEAKEWTVKSGYGLLGVRERAELLGGRLEAGPVEHGFRVRLWVPT